MRFLKVSTAVNITVLMVDSTDHVTGKTGLAAGLTIYLTKAGTAGVETPTVTEVDSTNVKGLYKLALTTTHTNTLGELQVHVTAAGADPTDVTFQVVTDLPGESVASVTGAVGSVTGAVGSVTGAVGSVAGNVDGNVTGSVGSLATQAKADVNAEVVDCLGTDTLAELSQAAPSATPSIKAALMLLYMALRNDLKSTATSLTISNDAGTVICKATLSDDGTTFERAELVSGP